MNRTLEEKTFVVSFKDIDTTLYNIDQHLLYLCK